MFVFTADTPWFKRAGLALFIAQFGLFVFGLPPFRIGIWPQLEALIVAIFALAAVNGFWLWLGICKGWLKNRQPFHPLWLCLALWVGWQLVATSWALSPWRSWFGPPDMGEGNGWYAATLLSMMLAYPLWQIASCRRVMIVAGFTCMLILCWLHLANPDEKDVWQPGKWPDYLGFMLGWLWIAVMTVTEFKSLKSYLGLAALSGFILYASDNDAARLFFPYAMLITGIALWSKFSDMPHFGNPGKTWKILAMIACVLPMSWIGISLHYQWFPDKFDGMGSRANLNQIAVTTMIYEPSRWLVGDGWGRFTDDSYKYALVGGVSHFADGKLSANSMLLENYAFHSHNEPMELLLSLGLPGLILWLAFPMLAIWYLPVALFWRVVPMLGAMMVLHNLWFALPQTMAFQALFWAALCSASPVPERSNVATDARKSGLVLLLSALVMAWSSWQQYDAMLYGQKLTSASFAEPPSSFSEEAMAEDLIRGGDHLRMAASQFAIWVATHNEAESNDNIRDWYMHFMRAAHRMALAPRIGVRASTLELGMQNMLVLRSSRTPNFNGVMKEAMAYYPPAATRLAVNAPLREDPITPFLILMMDTYHDQAKKIGILSRIMDIDPGHRSALWLLGKTLLEDPNSKEQGREMMQEALAMGVASVYPITDKEIAAFRASKP